MRPASTSRVAPPSSVAAVAAAVLALVAPRPVAADPAAGVAVDLATLPSLDARPAGTARGPVAGPIQLHAADADAARLRNLVAGVARVNLIELPVSGTRVTGRFGGDGKALTAALAAGRFGPVRALARKGKGPDVDLDFTGADRDDLMRVLAQVARTNVVVAVEGEQRLDVRLRRMPAGGALDVAAARLGLERTTRGNLVWLRAPGGPTLDRKLLALKGPRKVSLDVKGAHAGELYALLGSLGARVGGAACDAGAPLTFALKDVPVGTAVAVAAALSGQAPGAGAACAGDAPVRDYRDLELRAIGTVGARRAALFGAGQGSVIATRSLTLGGATIQEVGSAFVTFEVSNPSTPGELRTAVIHPSELFVDPASDGFVPPAAVTFEGPSERLERTLRDGRLAATIVSSGDARALFELPGDRWVVLGPGDLRGLATDAVVIEPGRVRYHLPARGSLDDVTGEIVLRARP